MGIDDRTWAGVRTPNKRIASFVLLIGACLVAIAIYRWSTGGEFNWFFLIVFLLFLFIYVFLVQSTAYEFLVSIEGEVPSLANRPPGCEFHTRCSYAESICRIEPPEMLPLSDGRLVRCHLRH